MRSLLFLAAAIWILASCNGVKNPEAGNTDLSADTYNKLKTINEGMADNEQAIRLAFNGFQPDAAPSEKVQKLAEMIHNGNCTRSVREPAEAYDHNWSGLQEVNGTSCPLALKQNWSFDARNRTWKVNSDVFVASSAAYQKESPIQSYSVTDGFLAVTETTSGHRVTGTINYYNFRVTGIGVVAANIRTEQNYGAVRGGGRIDMVIESFKQFKVNVFISWATGRTPIFKINNKTVDQKDVQDLFSSFHLLELIDRSQKML